MGAEDSLNTFTQKVVRDRKDSRILSWTQWTREDFQSHPCQWARPDSVSPLLTGSAALPPFPLCLVWWFNHTLSMLTPGKSGMPYFPGGMVIQRVRLSHSWNLVGDHQPQAPMLELSPITGDELCEVATASSVGGLDGWSWNEMKALSVGLARVLRCVETVELGPMVFLMLTSPRSPKAKGDSSTPLEQRPLCVLAVEYRVWGSIRLGHLQDWFGSTLVSPLRCSVLEGGSFRGRLVRHCPGC